MDMFQGQLQRRTITIVVQSIVIGLIVLAFTAKG